MIDILEIINNNNTESQLNFVIDTKKAQTQFLAMLEALFAHAINQLSVLRNNNPPLAAIVSEQTIAKLVQQDLTQLFFPVISRVCVYEMQVAAKHKKLIGATPEQRFDYFINLLKNTENILALLKKYPVMKDLIEKIYNQHLQNNRELLQRLADDYVELSQQFFQEKTDYQLSAITSGGDRHNYGRCVAILEFSNGADLIKVVYKPRPLVIDYAFQNLLTWFNKKSSIQLFQQQIIVKDNYGWCGFVEYLPCSNEENVIKFYQRMGGLLAISHLLGSTDIHMENIIAHGEHPVFIDFECSLQAFISNDDLNKELPCHLVSDTCLLPIKLMSRKDYNGLDISGIGAQGDAEAPYRKMQWAKSGTDEMHLIRDKVNMPATQNLPRLNDEPVNPLLYQQYVMAGFDEFYQIVITNKHELLAANSPLNAFARAQCRMVFRATNIYAKLLYESYHPILLHDKDKFQQHFLWLKEHIPPNSIHLKLVDSEIMDLLNNNIPFFTCVANGNTIYNVDNKALPIAVHYSGLEKVKQHLDQHFDADNLHRQCLIIENSFTALRLNQKKALPIKIDAPNISISVQNIKPQALEIAQVELAKLTQAAFISDGKIFWSCIEIVGIDAWTPSFTNIDLYDGISGIGLTFAYAAKIFENDSYAHMARLCLHTLLQTLDQNQRKAIQGVGGYSGLGGLLYSLAIFNQLTPDSRIAPTINTLLNWASDFIAEDKSLDIIAGSAGLIAALLSARAIIPTEKLTELLAKAAATILTQYPEPQKLAACLETTVSEQPLLGFSHGIAGFVWALVQANQILVDERIDQWIKAALIYERSYFNAQKNNWPDLRNVDSRHFHTADKFSCAWCHGAPGIGLARLDLKKRWNDGLINAEIAAAITATINQGSALYTNLCHGNLGNLDFLLEYYKKMPSGASQTNYESYTSAVIAQLTLQGTVFEINGALPLPGLMTGSAGVAYQMLRIAFPEQVPSVLLLQLIDK